MFNTSGFFSDFTLKWIPPDITNDKPTFVQVMDWCPQCWPSSMSPYGVTRGQWVDWILSPDYDPSEMISCHGTNLCPCHPTTSYFRTFHDKKKSFLWHVQNLQIITSHLKSIIFPLSLNYQSPWQNVSEIGRLVIPCSQNCWLKNLKKHEHW